MAKTPPTAAHGYSGKPLIAKLGWEEGVNALAIAPPDHYATLVDNAPIPVVKSPPRAGAYDFLHIFARDTASLAAAMPKLEPRLAQGGMIWVSWPKKSSSLFRDLTEDGIRAIILPVGLVDVKVCAVDADWSGLKLMRRKAS